MYNLFRAECYKLKRSRSFFACILAILILTCMIYGMLILADKIQKGEDQNGTGGVTVTVGNRDENTDPVTESLLDSIGVVDVIQQLFAGDFMAIILAVFASITIVNEYGSGTIKNVVGKGYSREKIFLTKFMAVSFGVFLFILFGVIVNLLGAACFLNRDVFYEGVWKDIGAFVGIQLIISLALGAVFTLIAEIGRNIAAAISASIGIALFSSLIFRGLDLIFIHMEFCPSEYWLMNMSASCPVRGFEPDYLRKTIVICLCWIFISMLAGIWHFKRADVK